MNGRSLTIVPTWAVSEAATSLLLVKVAAKASPVTATIPVIEAAPVITHAATAALGLELTRVAATFGPEDIKGGMANVQWPVSKSLICAHVAQT